jgi:hypothetical protein
VALDRIAHRYGVRPSVLIAGSPWALSFDWHILSRVGALGGGVAGADD